MSQSFALFSQPYLDRINQCYKNIVTINCPPAGPINKYVRRIQFPLLSEFKVQSSPCNKIDRCGLVLQSISNMNCCDSNLMTVNEIPDLMGFLMSNGYKVDTSLTKMFNASEIRFDTNNANKLICFVTYLK